MKMSMSQRGSQLGKGFSKRPNAATHEDVEKDAKRAS